MHVELPEEIQDAQLSLNFRETTFLLVQVYPIYCIGHICTLKNYFVFLKCKFNWTSFVFFAKSENPVWDRTVVE